MMRPIEIAGFGTTSPRLWPMGIGAGQPRAMRLVQGVPWRIEFAWDEAGRLVEVRHRIEPDPVHKHDVYIWRNDQIERIQHFEADLVDLLGDTPPFEEL